MSDSATSYHPLSLGFTLVQLLIVFVAAALVIASGIVIDITLHKTVSSTKSPTSISTTKQAQSQTNAERTAQNKRMCQAMSPEQKAQLAKMHALSPCVAAQ